MPDPTIKPWCCYLGCTNVATVRIEDSGAESYEDYTESCDDHIEELRLPESTIHPIPA